MLIIVNGRGYGCGKDTVVSELCKRLHLMDLKTLLVSSVSRVKEAAVLLGWNGEKTSEGRRGLGDLKVLADQYWDHSFNLACEVRNKADVVFMDVREPEKIQRLQDGLGAKYLYVDYATNEAAERRHLKIREELQHAAKSDMEAYNADLSRVDFRVWNDFRGPSRDFTNQVDRVALAIVESLPKG